MEKFILYEKIKHVTDDGCVEAVTNFIEAALDKCSCPVKDKNSILIAVDEIICNIVSYAYAPATGPVTVEIRITEFFRVMIAFIDEGKPFDPTKQDDPDITLSGDDREIGGLGIFMTKKLMDAVEYERKGNKNDLTIIKCVEKQS